MKTHKKEKEGLINMNIDKRREKLKKYRIEQDIDLNGSYIRIWDDLYLIFSADEEIFKFHPDWNLYFIGDLLNDIADDKGALGDYKIERTFAYNDPELLRVTADEVYELAEDIEGVRC